MKSPKSIDNKVDKVYTELVENLGKGSKVSVISAYFTIYAYESLKKELGKIDDLRLIFTEPTFVNKDRDLIREYCIDRERAIAGNPYEIRLRNEMKQAAIARECAEWLEKKVQVKSLIRSNPAQPRMIHIDNGGDNNSCINGTVDFTTDGLGITPSERIDMNACFYGRENTQFLLQMFNSIWNDQSTVEDVKAAMMENMRMIYKENAPQFIYFITLYNVFSAYLSELTEDNIIRKGIKFKETVIWNKLYKFQKDGALGAIDKLEKYNGCIIADSVGLGKTFTALAVIRYYELRNDRVLVLAPKKLRDNWTIYRINDKRNILAEDRFNFDVLNHTDLSRETGISGDIDLNTYNWGNCDLLVIDESHNFRNNEPSKGRRTRYQKLMEDIIKSGTKTKVLMLSATPVNNRMADIRNQIDFITEGDKRALEHAGISDYHRVMAGAQAIFNKWADLPIELRTTDRFLEMMDADYFRLLDILTIARSRKHLERYYNMDEIGKFPNRLPPINRYSEIDMSGEFPPVAEIYALIGRLTLCLYSPMNYLRSDRIGEYEAKYDMRIGTGNTVFRQRDRENSLVYLMRVNILKRMESSVNSLTITLERIIAKIDTMLNLIRKAGPAEISADIEGLETDDPALEDLAVGNTVKVNLKDMDLLRWEHDLLYDKEVISEIYESSRKVTPERDSKLNDLRNLVAEKIRNPINQGNGKIIVFTAFSDTAKYLYGSLSGMLKEMGIYSAMVTGGEGNQSTFPISSEDGKRIKMSDTNTVLTLFSPISKDCGKIFPSVQGRIDILFCTDCISEGQNLQDCDYLVNYDIHWNPVRIIQRFGRIDRIGSKNERIQLVSFWPMKDLDDYINLYERVSGRMVLADVSATGEENIIDASSKGMRDLEYRKNQMEKLQTEVVDLEEIKGGISITDLTFGDFRTDLMEYMREHRKELERSPCGMYAISTTDDVIDKPGAIFVLRQTKGSGQPKEQNPVFPYYLAYVTTDGEVRMSYVHTKRMLDAFRRLCFDKRIPLNELAAKFNSETADGMNMSKYSALLDLAVQNLVGKKREAGLTSLFSRGEFTGKSVAETTDDFELISFLVIMEKEHV
jgi:ERCC4-related helicase